MTPESEVHHPHTHRTGHRLLDLAVPLSALAISVISLIIGIHHGRTMQDMAKANARLVQANSWPLLQYVTGNATEAGVQQIELKVENAGVGPAKLMSLEIFKDEQRIRTPIDLVQALDPQAARPRMMLGMAPTVLRAGESMLVVGLLREGNEALWEKLNTARFQLKYKACYCSVFDECWVSDLVTMSPQPVEHCATSPDNFTYRDPVPKNSQP
jgi:hypothetical protein